MDVLSFVDKIWCVYINFSPRFTATFLASSLPLSSAYYLLVIFPFPPIISRSFYSWIESMIKPEVNSRRKYDKINCCWTSFERISKQSLNFLLESPLITEHKLNVHKDLKVVQDVLATPYAHLIYFLFPGRFLEWVYFQLLVFILKKLKTIIIYLWFTLTYLLYSL